MRLPMADENNQQSQNDTQNQETITEKKNKPLAKMVLVILMIFLGIFAITYVIVDRSMHQLGYTPFLVTMEQAQKMFDKDRGFIEKNSPAPVKIEQNKDFTTVTIDLKHFDNNEDNVNILIEDNGIKISGNVKKEENGNFREASFAQNVIFPQKFDKDKVTKTKKGNKLIIKLPFKSENQ